VGCLLQGAVSLANTRSHLSGALIAAQAFKPPNRPYEVILEFEKLAESEFPPLAEMERVPRMFEEELVLAASPIFTKSKSDNYVQMEVYKARTNILNQPVIVKRYHVTPSPSRSSSPSLFNTVLQEAVMQRRLDSYHICRLLSFTYRGSQACLVMESLEQDLEKDIQFRAQRKTPYTEPELVTIFSCVAEALLYAKMAGVAHRDVKPENVFMLDTMYCKVGDFGLACSGENRAVNGDGTESYLSPEMRFCMLGEIAEVNAYQSDIFSLGVTLLHAAKLAIPKQIASAFRSQEALEKAVEEELKGCLYSPGLQTLLKQMLLMDPKDRPTIEEITCKFKCYFIPGKGDIVGEILTAEQVDIADSSVLLTLAGECYEEFNLDLVMIHGLAYLSAEKLSLLEGRVSLEAWSLLAKALFLMGRYEETRRLLDIMLAKNSACDSKLVEMWILFGALSFIKKKYYEAGEALKMAIKAFNETSRKGQIPLNSSLIEKIQSGEVGGVALFQLSMLLMQICASEPTDTFLECMEASRKHLLFSNTSRAEALIRKAISIRKRSWELDPDLKALYGLMETDYQLPGKYFEVEELLLAALQVNWERLDTQATGLVQIYYRLADVFIKQGRMGEAEEIMLKVIFLRRVLQGPEHFYVTDEIMILAQNIYSAQGRQVEQELLLTSLIQSLSATCGETHVNLVRPYYSLACLYQAQRKWGEAEQHFHKALQVKGKLWQAHYYDYTPFIYLRLAQVYWQQGKLSHAEDAYQKVLSLRLNQSKSEKNQQAYEELAKLYKSQGYAQQDPDALQKCIDILQILETEDFEDSDLVSSLWNAEKNKEKERKEKYSS